ncbi:hypothetical protein [Pleurocapsa sp. FMAR1]|uniref:hypothetical protein n=1 Tax=Pleurocapsa sp. FMAR1 TaxID=3040204 RepID=UPI0029C98756|nr:hypothetical protein [Pleurocapsa sp. FMAR1]
MIHLISLAINRISSLLKKIQVKSFLTAVLLGAVLLTNGVSSSAINSKTAADVVGGDVVGNNPERPTTTREWRQQARRTEDAPLEKVKEIGKETGEALKDLGKLYPDVAESTFPDEIK